MPTNRTGNPLAAQTPSPAPGPGTIPVQSVPIDGEAANVASVFEALTTQADYVAHLNTTAQYRPPRNPNGSSYLNGFTAVTHTGGGGGSIAPVAISATQAQPTNTPYNYVIKITVGGAIGTAKYQYSTDGGNTYNGSDLTTASTITVPTPNSATVTLSLTGSFTSPDTYAFSATDTPIACFADINTNNHGLCVDHLGFPMGRYGEVNESWVGGSSYSVATGQTGVSFPTNKGGWLATTGTSGTVATNGPAAGYANPYLSLVTGATNASGSAVGMATGGVGVMSMSTTVGVYVLEFDWSVTVIGSNLMSAYMGWSDSLTPDTSNNNLAFFWKSGGTVGTNSLGVAIGTGGINVTNQVPFTVTGSATPNMRCRIEYGGSSTPLGATVRMFVNGQLVFTQTGGLPTSTAMLPVFKAIATSSTPTASVTLGGVRLMWNRWSQPELL